MDCFQKFDAMKSLLHTLTLLLAGAVQAAPPAVLPETGASPPSAPNGISVRVTLAQVAVSEKRGRQPDLHAAGI